ncbi:NHLP-related RiPP peptide [Lysobacter solisilvae (ex Woo and Kim 2020)]|uniref:Putative modified peptide n=1 Tax=Agrilutibacter terrestris TaxID=2865112 RepID=A0A7H0G0P2_9GAMM|nr:NHLP-related RiPP peptide [Lysobacter terrestris]QNP41858.1 putative modified peptide [Lysobacter terrestris]
MHTAVLDAPSTTAKPVAKKRSAPLDPQLADRLLDLLSTDDAFRQLFQTSPQAALRSIGYQPQLQSDDSLLSGLGLSRAPEPFSLCEIGHLASKQAIRDARIALKETFVQGLAYNTPTLDAANLTTQPKRK